MDDARIDISLDADDHAKLTAYAKQNNESLEEFILKALNEKLERDGVSKFQ